MIYRNTIEFEVSGDYALFSDPITRVGGEKTSYHIPTYEAIKGVVHSIYWKPTFIWVVDSLRVMKRIQTESKAVRPIKYNEKGNDLSYYTYLRNVSYQVRAHFEWNENRRADLEHDRNENKHHNIAKRMVERGGRRDIFLGVRECQAYVSPCTFGDGKSDYDTLEGEIDFGFQYHGITYADEAIREGDRGNMTVRFWHPVMKQRGIVEYTRPEDCTITRTIRPMPIKKFGADNMEGVEEMSI